MQQSAIKDKNGSINAYFLLLSLVSMNDSVTKQPEIKRKNPGKLLLNAYIEDI